MKTITETKQVFENLTELLNYSQGQITAQQLINKRIYLKSQGWTSIELSDELMENIISQIVETLGGRNSTKSSIKNVLRYSKPQHWGLNRILLEQYDNSEPCFKYCAGQDYTWETNTIRRFLSK